MKYLEFFSPSSYHFVRDLTIAPCVLSFNIILRSCFKTSIFSIIVSKSALGFCISSCKFWSLVSISLISALILLFLSLANLIVWPLMTHLIVSHKREGLASLLVSFTSSITCLTSLTYSKSYKRLQLSFQYPGPRFNIKMSSYRYRKSHCGDKTVVRSSYLHNGISYTSKMSSLYWIGALVLFYFHMPSRRVQWKNGQSQTHMIF